MDSQRQHNYRLPPQEVRKKKTGRAVRLILSAVLVCGLAAGAFYFWRVNNNDSGMVKVPVADSPYIVSAPKVPAEEPEPEPVLLPVGKLFVTDERKAYRDGEIVLEIPRLNLSESVLNLPDPDVDGEDAVNKRLNEGVGLFFCAQPPGPGNPNTSIAGHRDIYGNEFYYLDTLTAGDTLYLLYGGKRYVYEYVDTIIINPNDAREVIWQPMMTKDYSAITLQTCDPIGVASHRMFVTGRLVAIEDL